MANFNVTLNVSSGKGGSAAFAATNGDGLSSGDPLDVNGGDTVTFICGSGSSGTARFRDLSIFTSNADIDILAGGANVVRTVASGSLLSSFITGLNGGQVASDFFYFKRLASSGSVTAPTASSVTFNNPASANTTATVNLSASGSGGTLQYACEVGDSTPDNWQSGSTFTISRGSGTVYARARRSSTTNSNTVSATRPGFLTGDTAVAASSSTIANGATSASTTLSSATAGETYAVRVNNGSSNLATRTGNGAVSFTSSLPSSGNTSTYEIFVRRPTSTGGDGTTYTATNDTFTVSMSSPAQDTTPNSFTLQNVTNAGVSTVYQSVAQQVTGITGTVTVTVSGDGNPQVKIGSGSWTSGPTTITNNYYINARLTSSASNSTAHTATVTVGTYSTTFVVTTVAASGGSSGGTSGGSGTYGIEIYDTDGTTTVLSPSTRYMNFMQGPQTITVPANSSVLLQQDMTGLTTSNSDIAFTEFGNFTFTVTRITTGAVSSQGFQLNNANAAAFTAKPYILRF
jgi:hypothetical protein